jgi:hypothetical protein
MEEIEQLIEELLMSDPEFTFREVCAELVKKGVLPYEALGDHYLSAALQARYQRSKTLANANRINLDI